MFHQPQPKSQPATPSSACSLDVRQHRQSCCYVVQSIEAGLVLARRFAADDDDVLVAHEGSSTPARSLTM
jgi:hypothetical protein